MHSQFFFFQTNIACTDCLDNTVICSGQKILCAPIHTLRDEQTRTFQDHYESLESSKFRRSINPAPAPALDHGCRTGPALGAGACCGEVREGLLWRQRRRRHGSQTLNLLPLMNGVSWDAEARLQFAELGCIWNRGLQLEDQASNMS